MAAPIGCVSEFDNSKETWCTYIERLESFFNVNDIAEGKKSDFLVSVMGSETYGLLTTLMAPTKPSTKPFSELVKTLGDHLDPSPQKWESGFVLDVVFRMTARALHRSWRSYDVCLYIAVMGKPVYSVTRPICVGSLLRGYTEETGNDQRSEVGFSHSDSKDGRNGYPRHWGITWSSQRCWCLRIGPQASYQPEERQMNAKSGKGHLRVLQLQWERSHFR